MDHLVQEILPWFLGVVAMVGAWLIRKVLFLDNWRSGHEASANEWRKSHESAMSQATIAMESVVRQQQELATINRKLDEVNGEIKGNFGGLDVRLNRIEQRCVAHLRAVAEQNGINSATKET